MNGFCDIPSAPSLDDVSMWISDEPEWELLSSSSSSSSSSPACVKAPPSLTHALPLGVTLSRTPCSPSSTSSSCAEWELMCSSSSSPSSSRSYVWVVEDEHAGWGGACLALGGGGGCLEVGCNEEHTESETGGRYLTHVAAVQHVRSKWLAAGAIVPPPARTHICNAHTYNTHTYTHTHIHIQIHIHIHIHIAYTHTHIHTTYTHFYTK